MSSPTQPPVSGPPGADPSHAEGPSGRAIWSWVVGSVALWWLGFWVPLVAFAAVAVSVFAALRALRSRRWVALAVGLLLIPPTVAAGGAAVAYGLGDARLQTVGLPNVTLHNVDRETRYQWSTTGCIVSGTEWVHQVPANATLRALSWLLGPMPGAYDGPYPTDAEARTALTAGVRLSAAELAAASITTEDGPLGIPPALHEPLRAAAREGAEVRAAVWQWRMAVFGVTLPSSPRQDRIAPGAPPRSALIFVDRHTGRVVAYQGAFTILAGALPVPWR